MSRYSRLALALLVLCLLGNSSCTMWGEKKNATWKSATSGEQITKLFWEDVKKKDWKVVQERLASTAVGLNSQGTLHREQMIEHIKQLDISEFQVGEVTSEPAGTDLVVTYTLTVRGTIAGKPLPASVHMMSVWQHIKNGWILIAHSSIPAQS